MSDTNSPVDEPPGKDGTQGQANPDEVFPIPEWPPGANPPGTHPPIDPELDPALHPIPGSVPTFGHPPASPGEPTDPPTDVPLNIDVPNVSQAGATLTCTQGNWDHEPTSYAYAWQINGNGAGTDAATYDVQSGDIGGTATCTVTATNGFGSTTAPPSNGVTVVDPAGATS